MVLRATASGIRSPLKNFRHLRSASQYIHTATGFAKHVDAPVDRVTLQKYLAQHPQWHTNPETGEREPFLSFVEEPIGIPAANGVGYLQVEFGETVCDGRYEVLRKLGWGIQGSVWLVRDSRDQKYYAMKALTGSHTALKNQLEINAFRELSGSRSSHLLHLEHHWTQPGRGSSGSHLCLITQLLGSDLLRICAENSLPRFPLPLAKHILLHVLRGLVDLHSHGIAHTDIKPANIYADVHLSGEALDRWLAETPPRRNAPELSSDGILRSAVSQPLPVPETAQLQARSFVLGDLGCAMTRKEREAVSDGIVGICPISLRPPEIFLGGPWDEKLDIWMFGCLAYELIVGKPPLRYKEDGEVLLGNKLDSVESMLLQMIIYSGQSFEPEQLLESHLADLYFQENCRMINPPKEVVLSDVTLARGSLSGIFSDDQSRSIMKFVRKCLRLNPNDRPAPADLLQDSFWDE